MIFAVPDGVAAALVALHALVYTRHVGSQGRCPAGAQAITAPEPPVEYNLEAIRQQIQANFDRIAAGAEIEARLIDLKPVPSQP